MGHSVYPSIRRGYTLVELLVVIAIIGILIALLLPAVQAAREASRRTACQNKLKQIGLALHNRHDSLGQFPPAHWQDPNQIADNYGQPAPLSTEYYFSWLTRILPYIEQGNLHDQVRFDEWIFPNPPQGLPDGGFANDREIAQFFCPSFPKMNEPCMVDYPPVVGHSHTHYLGVNGTDQFMFDGIMYVNSRVKIDDIKDGTSHTLLVGERPPTFDRDAGWWFAGSGFYPWFGAADVVLGTEEKIGDSWACTPAGTPSKYQRGSLRFENDGHGWDKHAWHFWSYHSGEGALFVFADGHVKFVPYSVAKDVFRNLGTIKGGEASDGVY